MKEIYEFSQVFMKKLNLPQEAIDEFNRVQEIIMDTCKYRTKYLSLRKLYILSPVKESDPILKSLSKLASEIGVSEYTVHFIFLMNCADDLLRRYKAKGISEEIFWDTMYDFRCKMMECYEVKGVWGTFVAGWYDGFFAMTRFALGRFQFEMSHFGLDEYTCAGKTVKKGDNAIGMHIPSSGVPLTDEIRLDAYKRGYEFYKKNFKGEKLIPFVCGSWLLFEGNYEFLPEKMNIVKFMNDFDIVESTEKDNFGDAWRIFGKHAGKPVEELPKDTSLRKAFAERFQSGKKAGSGYGIFLFDGEKVINKRTEI